MKKIYLMLGILLFSGLVIGGLSLIPRENTIILDKATQDIFEERDLDNPTISDLVCDEKKCRSCASKGDYGMGCITIHRKKCSSYSTEGIGECLAYTDYTDNELASMEIEAYKIRWKDISEIIVKRENEIKEIKLGSGEITLTKKK